MTEDDTLRQLRAELTARRSKLSPAQQALLEQRLRSSVQDQAPGQDAQASIPRRTEQDPAPLSSAQQRLWFFSQLEPESTAYTLANVLRLEGWLDVGALERALNELVARHEILRTVFEARQGQPLQRVLPSLSLPLPLVTLAELPPQQQAAQTEQLIREEITRPFDLARGPLLRAHVLRQHAASHLLLLVMHHIIFDGWSFGIIVREMAALYQAARSGALAALPPVPLQYADFAAWQRSELTQAAQHDDLAYWSRQLAGAPALLALPTDTPRPAVQRYRGCSCEQRLPPSLLVALTGLSRREGATLFMTLLAGFQALLSRYSGQTDLLVGTPIAGRTQVELEQVVGCFVNMLALRTDLSGNPSCQELLGRVRTVALEAYAHQELPFEQVVEALQPARSLSYSPIFQVFFALQNMPLPPLELEGLRITPVEVPGTTAKFDLTLTAQEQADGLRLVLEYDTDLFSASTAERLLRHYVQLLSAMVASPSARLHELAMLSPQEQAQLLNLGSGAHLPYPHSTIPALFFAQAARTPLAPALLYGRQCLDYTTVAEQAARLAHLLRARGVGPEVRVGVCLERSPLLVVALLGLLAAGGAYVPLDPHYPPARRHLILADAGIALVLTQASLLSRLAPVEGVELLALDTAEVSEAPAACPTTPPQVPLDPDNLAYVIYTSGSTGTPKGVMVSHRNVVNFFTAMGSLIGDDSSAVWLAVTSVSFDISVLELLWTLSHGARIVLHSGDVVSDIADQGHHRRASTPLEFSLFYFASDEAAETNDKYYLLMEGAKFADEHGFAAVWTPERHFHNFGGLYASPSVISAALAAVTRRIQIRAGSVVLPLHDPIRVVEEWSIVDNLSHGRVGLSFASGWNANDFVFSPEHYAKRRDVLRDHLDAVRGLWRGEPIMRLNGAGREVELITRPRPVQPDLPVWLTSAGSVETFRLAGETGANVLTHLLGQSIDDVAEKIAVYRRSWLDHGHGPGAGHVTLMIHTFVEGDADRVRETIRRPFIDYLRSSADLIRNFAHSLGYDAEIETLAESDVGEILDLAFDRYVETSGLFGTPETCRAMIEKLRAADVDEIACLIDFGVDADAVLASLPYLDRLRALNTGTVDRQNDESIATQILRNHVSHFQCTPSLARLLIEQEATQRALGPLRTLLIGGEEFPPALAAELPDLVSGAVYNMYGPTETTIWSTAGSVRGGGEAVTIGRPIANTDIVILDEQWRITPPGVEGELCIGGAGLARGYYRQPGLTAERFAPHPYSTVPGVRLYHTGDRGRWRADGTLEYLGRRDGQVKVHGFRIEVGEIEAALNRHPAVRQAVVKASGTGVDRRLVAYVVPDQEQRTTQRVPDKEQKSETPDSQFSILNSQFSGGLRAFLKEKLPDYLVPSLFVALDALPLTPNGKVDRNALPAPDALAPAPAAVYQAPETSTEQVLAAVWAAVLNRPQIGRHDNFFEIGGDSIHAIRVISLAGANGLAITPRQLFQHPTVAALAAVATPTAVAEAGPGPVPLTPMAGWLLEQQLSVPAHFNQAVLLASPTPLDVQRLQQALDALLDHHQALRLRLHPSHDHAAPASLEIAPPGSPATLELHHTSADPAARAAALSSVALQLHSTLDLPHGPLLRAALFRCSAGATATLPDQLLLVIHHLAIDVVSWRILLDDLHHAYAAQMPPAVVPTPYRAWAEAIEQAAHSAALQHEVDYWRTSLAAPVQALPCDLYEGANSYGSARTYTVLLEAEQTAALLRQAPQAYRMQPTELLLAALLLALARQWGLSTLLLDLERHGRDEELPGGEEQDLSRTVGWLTALYPLRLTAPQERGLEATLKQVKEQVRAVPGRGRGYGILRYLAEVDRLPAAAAELSFNYIGQWDRGAEQGGEWRLERGAVGPGVSPHNQRAYLLEVIGRVVEGRLELGWTYSVARHRPETVQQLAQTYLEVLRELIAHCLSSHAGALTPADFPLAGVNEKDLATITHLLRKTRQS